MTGPTCLHVRDALPAFVETGGDTLTVRRHLVSCTECRQELERYETLTASLASLATATATPPRSLHAALVRIPEEASRVHKVRSHVRRHRNEYIGGAILVAGAAGAALLRSRARRVATA